MKNAMLAATVLILGTLMLSAQTPERRTGLLGERGMTAANYPEIKKISEGVYVWSDVHPNGIYLTNDLIVVTTDGVLVADGQKDPATTKKMVDGIKKLTDQPIKYVIVCSEHGDHTGGNESFPSTATFISSPVSKANLAEQATHDRPTGPKTIVPTDTVADRKVLKVGNTEVQIVNNGKAHTGGDIEVYLPAQKVFFVSEVFSNHIFPNMRAAPPSEWIGTLKKIEQVDARWVIPGHGFVDSPEVLKEELASFAKATEYIVAEVTRLHKAGVAVEAAQTQVNWGPYAKWPVIDRNGPVAVQRVYDELNGKLK